MFRQSSRIDYFFWGPVNVAIRSDPAGSIKADKEKSKEKIDGV